MVQSYANSVEDRLVDGLSFKLTEGASYINERKIVTYHPQGSNIYKPGAGTKLIKIAITGQDWLDPTTSRVMFDVVNTPTIITTNKLRPASGPWSVFRRVRLLAGGQLIEDIDYYNRVHEMMEILTASDSHDNESVEGFGYKIKEHGPRKDRNLELNDINGVTVRLTVCVEPLCGLLNQNKFIPLACVQSLSLELELVDNALEPLFNVNTTAIKVGIEQDVLNDFTCNNTSTEWQIEQVQVKCDVISLDTQLQDSYTELLMDVQEFPIHYTTLTSQYKTIRNQNQPFVNVSRAATRLKSIFVSFDKDLPKGPPGDPWNDRTSPTRKTWNEFFSPGSSNNTDYYNPQGRDEFEFQV